MLKAGTSRCLDLHSCSSIWAWAAVRLRLRPTVSIWSSPQTAEDTGRSSRPSVCLQPSAALDTHSGPCSALLSSCSGGESPSTCPALPCRTRSTRTQMMLWLCFRWFIHAFQSHVIHLYSLQKSSVAATVMVLNDNNGVYHHILHFAYMP